MKLNIDAEIGSRSVRTYPTQVLTLCTQHLCCPLETG